MSSHAKWPSHRDRSFCDVVSLYAFTHLRVAVYASRSEVSFGNFLRNFGTLCATPPPPHICRYRAEDTLRCATFRDISVDVLFFAVPTDRPTRRPAFSAAARWHFQSPARAPRGATRRSLRQVSKTSSAITGRVVRHELPQRCRACAWRS